jgi:hypothetical protein
MSILVDHQAVASNEDTYVRMPVFGPSWQLDHRKIPFTGWPTPGLAYSGLRRTGFNAAIASDHLLEPGGERSIRGKVGDSLSELETGQSRSSTTGSPFQSEGSALPASDSYLDDWLLVD